VLPRGLHLYGSEAAEVTALAGGGRQLGGGLTVAMVRFAARYEYARTVEDVLARRCRLLFLDAAQAAGLAAEVGELLRQETGVDPKPRPSANWPRATSRCPPEAAGRRTRLTKPGDLP
jgi:glycerol-3-phosphate dehydrogenase